MRFSAPLALATVLLTFSFMGSVAYAENAPARSSHAHHKISAEDLIFVPLPKIKNHEFVNIDGRLRFPILGSRITELEKDDGFSLLITEMGEFPKILTGELGIISVRHFLMGALGERRGDVVHLSFGAGIGVGLGVRAVGAILEGLLNKFWKVEVTSPYFTLVHNVPYFVLFEPYKIEHEILEMALRKYKYIQPEALAKGIAEGDLRTGETVVPKLSSKQKLINDAKTFGGIALDVAMESAFILYGIPMFGDSFFLETVIGETAFSLIRSSVLSLYTSGMNKYFPKYAKKALAPKSKNVVGISFHKSRYIYVYAAKLDPKD